MGEATGASPLSVPSSPPCLHCPWELPPGSLGPWVPSPCGPHELHGQPVSGRKRGLAGRGWVRRGCGPEEERLACRFVWMLKLAACECRAAGSLSSQHWLLRNPRCSSKNCIESFRAGWADWKECLLQEFPFFLSHVVFGSDLVLTDTVSLAPPPPTLV